MFPLQRICIQERNGVFNVVITVLERKSGRYNDENGAELKGGGEGHIYMPENGHACSLLS
jgi:hypothetical protein